MMAMIYQSIMGMELLKNALDELLFSINTITPQIPKRPPKMYH